MDKKKIFGTKVCNQRKDLIKMITKLLKEKELILMYYIQIYGSALDKAIFRQT
jgi:hypothetical protein